MPRKTKTNSPDASSLKLKLGDALPIEPASIRNLRFTISEIRASVAGSNYPIVDYVDSGHKVRLRLIPGLDSNSQTNYRAIVLRLYDSFSNDQGMLDVVRDDSKLLKIEDITDPKKITHDEFWRIGDIADCDVTQLNILSSEGHGHTEIESWAYSRLIDVDGIETEEFIFIEMNLQDGFFEIWRGCEVKR